MLYLHRIQEHRKKGIPEPDWRVIVDNVSLLASHLTSLPGAHRYISIAKIEESSDELVFAIGDQALRVRRL